MKFRLFTAVQFSLFLLISGYLTAKLTFGSRGILEYYKLEETYISNKITLGFLEKENKKLETKLKLLNENSVNLSYLEEMARVSLHFGKEGEKLIIIEND